MLRGVMFAAIQRESGTKSAIVLTSLVYAAVHFLANYLHCTRAGDLAQRLDPAGRNDQLVLAAAGDGRCLHLSVRSRVGPRHIRARTGNIAACIGLHAGWVWVMLIARELTKPVRDQPLSFLLSQFDGFMGWLVFAWTVLMGIVLVRFYLPAPDIPGVAHEIPAEDLLHPGGGVAFLLQAIRQLIELVDAAQIDDERHRVRSFPGSADARFDAPSCSLASTSM